MIGRLTSTAIMYSLRSLFEKKVPALRVTVYEDGKPTDLERLDDGLLQNLRLSILDLWETSKASAVFFDCEAYNPVRWGKSLPLRMDIVCYIRDQHLITGQRKINIPSSYLDRMVGRRFQLTPESKPWKHWSAKTEVVFTRA